MEGRDVEGILNTCMEGNVSRVNSNLLTKYWGIKDGSGTLKPISTRNTSIFKIWMGKKKVAENDLYSKSGSKGSGMYILTRLFLPVCHMLPSLSLGEACSGTSASHMLSAFTYSVFFMKRGYVCAVLYLVCL